MIKIDIVKRISNATGQPNDLARLAVDSILTQMRGALAAGERIELRGLGVFRVAPKKTGLGRNPKTGDEVRIKPGKTVKFRPGRSLRESARRLRSPSSEQD